MKKSLKFLFLFSVIMFVNSCDEDQQVAAPVISSEVSKAKDWFESQIVLRQRSMLNVPVRERNTGIPDWSNALISNGKEIKTIEVPLSLHGNTVASIDNSRNKLSASRLLIHEKEGVYSALVMTMIPSDDADQVSFLNQKAMLGDLFKKFSWIISFSKWGHEDIVNSYLIEKGRIVRKSTNSKDQSNKRSECYAITTHYYTSVCSSFGCSYSYDYSSTQNFCVHVSEPQAQSDLPAEYTEGGGGGEVYSNEETLNQILAFNPAFLLEIPCDQLAKWQALAQFIPPQIIKNKINQLQSANNSFDDWAIQTLNGASGTIVNMDYFSVNVTTLPVNPITGVPYTPQEFLNYFRRNINNFVDGSTFTPYCEIPSLCTQETNLWSSSNPTGAIVYIDIPGDDGAVICSEYTSSYWYFTTLEAPGAGNHPVSGTRQFGFESNGSGGYNFFVRGVDRFDSNMMAGLAYVRFVGNPFSGAETLWKSFQRKMFENITMAGGTASVNPPVIYRPDWDKVEQILNGERPLSELGCN